MKSLKINAWQVWFTLYAFAIFPFVLVYALLVDGIDFNDFFDFFMDHVASGFREIEDRVNSKYVN